MRIKFVSTYPPTRCGLAEYTKNLANSLKKIGENPKVVKIDQPYSSRSSYFVNLAKKTSKGMSDNDIIHIQFQIFRFGKLLKIFPGFYIIYFLKTLKNNRAVQN